MKEPVLILGATSDMARAIAHAFAARGHPLQLAARSSEALEPIAMDLRLRHGVEASVHVFEILAFDAHAEVLDSLPAPPLIAVMAVGAMGDQDESERDMDAAAHVFRTNYEGPARILGLIANHFAERGAGVIVGISSVAGLRGRATNYIYGSAKAGLTAYLSGLRNRLAGRGVRVVTVLPGFVNTAMTEDMDLPLSLTAEPEEVATAVMRALDRGRDVIYVRRVWWIIMIVIRAIPESLFKRMRI